jgi:hypothetical protein
VALRFPPKSKTSQGYKRYSSRLTARKSYFVIRKSSGLLCATFPSTKWTQLMSIAPKMIPQPVIIGFFLLGLLSSIAFRAIIILQKYDPAWVRPVWYFGVLGYLVFFMYRYYISQRRKRTIAHTAVIEKISTGEVLNHDEREAALYLLKSVRASQEDWNYLAIFVLSIVAIALDLLLPGK